MQLSDRDISIMLGAQLVHWGYPFHFASKRELDDGQQQSIDLACEKLISLRSATKSNSLLDLDLSSVEIDLFIVVLENCLEEFDDNAVDLRLHLNADHRKQVEDLIGRLKESLKKSKYQPVVKNVE